MSNVNGISPAAIFSQLPALTPTNAVIALGSVVIVALVLKSLCNKQKEPQSAVPSLAGRTQPDAAAIQVSTEGLGALDPTPRNGAPGAPPAVSRGSDVAPAANSGEVTPKGDQAARRVVRNFGASQDPEAFVDSITAALTPPGSKPAAAGGSQSGKEPRNPKRKKAD